jgi:plasmid stability protein
MKPLCRTILCDIIIDIRDVSMGQILVRNISEDALKTLRNKAQFKGQSLESVVRELIEAEGAPNRDALLDEMRRIRAMTPGIVPSLTSADYRDGLE